MNETIPTETTPAGSANLKDNVSDYIASLSGSNTSSSQVSGIFDSWSDFFDFLIANQVVFVLILALLGAALIGLVLWNRHRRKAEPGLVQSDSIGLFSKALCMALVLLLIFSDYTALQNMFKGFRMSIPERRLFSATFALFLEGFPFVLGIVVPKIKDPAQPYAGKKARLRTVAVICWCCLIVTFALSIGMRYLYTEQPSRGGFEAFMAGTYNSDELNNRSDKYLGELFLFFSPVLTSLLAYVVTSVVFGSSNLDDAAKRCAQHRKRADWFQAAYDGAVHRKEDAAHSLWYTLGYSVDDPVPSDFDEYRDSCHVKIHDMIINNCLYAYPSLLKRYNERVEASLNGYINELAKYSSTPNVITRISVDEIIDKHDASVGMNVDAWDYERCEPVMCGDLERLLHSAVIMAQFKRASKKYKFEKEW